MKTIGRIKVRLGCVIIVLLAACLTGFAENRPTVVIADFEGPDYKGWDVTGNAFGKTPAAVALEYDGYLGKGFVCTIGNKTGEMITAPFKVSRDYIRFMVGGKSIRGLSTIYLVVDGKVVREAGGAGKWHRRWISQDRDKDIFAELMIATDWDVREFAGKEARIKIVDRDPMTWIMVDQIELTDEPLIPTLRFGRIYTDDMLIQQQKKARVWGYAKPGAEVTVTITEDESVAKPYLPTEEPKTNTEYEVKMSYTEKNAPTFSAQKKTAKTDEKGKWQVEFAPMVASFTPKYIVAKSGDKGFAIKNVLIGELWVCVGQSNMKLKGFNRMDREGGSADFPGVRYVAWNSSWNKPLDEIPVDVKWYEASSDMVLKGTAEQFSAVPYLYAMFLHRYLKVPVGVINVARGGTTGRTWNTREELESIDNEIVKADLKKYDDECAAWVDADTATMEQLGKQYQESCDKLRSEHEKLVATAKAENKKAPELKLPPFQTANKGGDPRSGWSPPTGMFNATIMPIRHLGIRGVLYYQGENEVFGSIIHYEYTFPKIRISMRKAFGEPELPFGCIIQPGWGTYGADPESETIGASYQNVRDIQYRALKNDPHSGTIATYPAGNADIHPSEKLPVAEYASLWALAKVYNKPVAFTGPIYKAMKNKDSSIHLFFEDAYGMPETYEGSGDYRGFIIADSDKRWYPAKAKASKLDGKSTVEVTSDLVKDPVAVRYGWACWPTGNMVGKNNLPMPTFRTDDWPLPPGLPHTIAGQAESDKVIGAMKETAKKQALDRKMRQMLIDLPAMESQLTGGGKKLAESRIARLEAIANDLLKNDNVFPEGREQITQIKKTVDDLKAKAEAAVKAEAATKAKAATKAAVAGKK